MTGPKYQLRNPLTTSWEQWKADLRYQVSGQAVKDVFSEGGGMGVLLGAGLSIGRSILKRGAGRALARAGAKMVGRKAAKAVARAGVVGIAAKIGGTIATAAAADYVTSRIQGRGTGPSDMPADFGGGGYGGGGGYADNYAPGAPGTNVATRSGGGVGVALPNGAFWKNGHMYIGRQTANGGIRMQRVVYDKMGNLVPAHKKMNVLNPRALGRATRRVEGFHKVATKAVKNMEKWARKHTRHAPAAKRAAFGKKK